MEAVGVLLRILVPNAVVLLIGFGVVWAARRRPGTVAAVIGVVVAAGLVVVRYGAAEADTNLELGRLWFGVGMVLVLIGCPAWLLIGPAREPNGATVGPVGRAEWGKLAGAYLGACWLLAFVLSVLLFLTTTPSSQFR